MTSDEKEKMRNKRKIYNIKMKEKEMKKSKGMRGKMRKEKWTRKIEIGNS